jgi:hypothetical protein
MSVVGDVLNQLGQTVIPDVAAIVFGDLMTIKRRTPTNVMGSEKIVTADVYADISVTPPQPISSRSYDREMQAENLVGEQLYKLTFPTHQDGERIEIDKSKDYLVLAERGNEPERTFRIIKLANSAGVKYEVACVEV